MTCRSGSPLLALALTLPLAASCATGRVAPATAETAPPAAPPSTAGGGGASTSDASAPPALGNASVVSYGPVPTTADLTVISALVAADQAKRGGDAQYYRYTYIPTAFLGSNEDTNYARIGITKALNLVAYQAEEIVPLEDISGSGTVFAFDLRKYLVGDFVTKWAWVAAGVVIPLVGPLQGNQDDAEALALAPFDPNEPVPADRLAYNLIHGGIYVHLIDTPTSFEALTKSFNLGGRTATMAFEHAITKGVRYAERKTRSITYADGGVALGVCWTTSDPFDPVTGGDTTLPWLLDGGAVPTFDDQGTIADYKSQTVTETICGTPNGLFVSYINGEHGQPRSHGDSRFVIDTTQNVDITTGMSCVSCHAGKVNFNLTAMTGLSGAAATFWTDPDTLMGLFDADRVAFQAAMRRVVLSVSDGSANFNSGIIDASDLKEPFFYLIRNLTNTSGDTAGRNRRRSDDIIPGASGQTPMVASGTTTTALSFAKDVLPILSKNGCTSCHAELLAEATVSRELFEKAITNVAWGYMPLGTPAGSLSQSDFNVLAGWQAQVFPN